MLRYLKDNKHWIFSGIGVFIVGLIISAGIYIWRSFSNPSNSNQLSSNQSNTTELHINQPNSNATLNVSPANVSQRETPGLPTNKTSENSKKPGYHFSKELKEGETFLDPYTGAALGVSQIYMSNRAEGSISLPGKESQDLDFVKPGTAWRFQRSGSTYSLVITKINYSDKSFHVDISQEKD